LLFVKEGGRRYYYYICSKDTKRAISECPVKQIPFPNFATLNAPFAIVNARIAELNAQLHL
jgi:hypothetical protein